MKTASHLAAVAVAAALLVPSWPLRAQTLRTKESFDANWLFTKGDPADDHTQLTYAAVRPWLLPLQNPFTTNAPAAWPADNFGGDVSYAQPGFDDTNWRKLNLPHDFGIEGPFQQALPGDTAKLPWFGVAWYRKHFDLPPEDSGKEIFLDVDGAMAYSTVWINGHCVGGWPYGYASWQVDLTPYVKFGGANTVAIRLDNPKNSSRWYPGGGIYRNVWLTKTFPIHVSHWGTYITTPVIGPARAVVAVKTQVENQSTNAADLNVETEIYELDRNGVKQGGIVASQSAPLTLPAGTNLVSAAELTIADPKLWNLDQPNRYLAVTTLRASGGDSSSPARTWDVVENAFGIRTIEFTKTDGFLLNGKRVPINGVCDHHDLGALGSAINTRALDRQLQILRGMGCNAIRTSHNPPAPELLELCDRLGLVVMDEAFDCWIEHKTPNDYATIFNDWHEADVRAYVRRDRNHPCVVLWSIGNEIDEQAHPHLFYIAQNLAAAVRREDATRPITAACNHTEAGYNGFQHIVDVFGYNYKPWEYGKFRAA
ncbi:MAG TPA: glycoside hydrolase family 2 TIM barrel-domain containing protein, partial [Candidatus Acidoferrales bacterium]|nr:glycoside hydrolase family 2 TIM barrel-domain containing protein [Candidatus Acidoferrales bacterium]